MATVSEYSKQDIIKNYHIEPSKIDVVYNGSNLLYTPISDELKQQTKKEYSNGNAYFLFVGAMHPRKNIVNLFKAFDVFKSKGNSSTKLLIVGNKMYWRKDIDDTYEQMKFNERGSIYRQIKSG